MTPSKYITIMALTYSSLFLLNHLLKFPAISLRSQPQATVPASALLQYDVIPT